MAGETPPIVPAKTFEAEPVGLDPKELPVGVNISGPTTENHTSDQTPEDTFGDPVNSTSVYNNDDPPVIEPWRSDSEGSPKDVVRPTPKETTLQAKPSKKNRSTLEDPNGFLKKRHVTNADFYNEPFTFTETQKNVRNLVTSPFTARIRDYDISDGLKVPTNLKTYDNMSDQGDHLTVFMGTMDVHKLPEPA
ncbi:hypothetical protein CTI12_AA072290 [Artemisia annua]|uniref:Uncharacterized protein n=1 Tax=Artemisia annua TaxID=35608 RepID=A0A2U1Q625_ARTAN|nr:hypothetical protein CTI12_AA072290 [Artemisia annua]